MSRLNRRYSAQRGWLARRTTRSSWWTQPAPGGCSGRAESSPGLVPWHGWCCCRVFCGVLRRKSPSQSPSPATLTAGNLAAGWMKFRDVRTARRGAQTKNNKRTVWALRRVIYADHIIRRLHQYYAPLPPPHGQQQRVNVPSLLKVIAPDGAFALFLDECDWRAFRCTCVGVCKIHRFGAPPPPSRRRFHWMDGMAWCTPTTRTTP